MAKSPRSGAPVSGNRAAGSRGAGAKAAASNTAVAKTAQPDAPRPRVSPVEFFRQVRAEGRKITWTGWKETWITSIMVFILVALAAIFLYIVDFGLGQALQQLLRLAAR